jgi:pimeloyl-ACP methyl ester carboxylesterase
LEYIKVKVLYPTNEVILLQEQPDMDFFVSKYDYSVAEKGLHCRYYHNHGEKTIMFCHGTTGNISHRQYMITICKLYDINLLLFDYSGYGQSEGYSTLDTILADGQAVYIHLARRIGSDNIIVWGESLGGAVATYIASKYPCYRLLLFCTFSSLDDILIYSNHWEKMIDSINLCFSKLMNNLDTKLRIKKVKAPVIIVHSVEDDLIPYQCALRLHKLCPSRKQLVTIKGGHISPVINQKQLDKIFRFCDIQVKPHNLSKEIGGLIEDFKKLPKNE